MQSVRKPRWQQATALMSLSTCGAMTGFAFAHGTVADLTSPTSMPVHLLAATRPAQAEPTTESALRSAIVKAATYYLRLARDNSPAEIESMIWQKASAGGTDHGESCAAFASLVVEMGAQATGQESWVSGGGTYPYALHGWADVRVEPNPNSPNVVSIQQDAETHGRWHPLGDGYTPQPGDWVLFDGHVEVVTTYAGGVLDTIGGDSMPNLSVNAHRYGDPLAEQGVIGFVNNGELVTTTSQTGPAAGQRQADLGQTAIPGLMSDVLSPGGAAQAVQQAARPAQQQSAGVHAPPAGAMGSAEIPGLEDLNGILGAGSRAQPSAAYGRNQTPTAHVPDTATQQAFISEVAPGAVAAQRTYGIPASVTIAQAIDESGWGQSQLAAADHNLFGIKGTGPAGAVTLPTEEYQDGSWVATSASFRVYHNVAQSIADHSKLLATGESYQQAMANRHAPDAFAHDLTGVYATDPNYGSNLIAIMRLYNLYRYDPTPSASTAPVAATPPAPPVTTPVAAVDHNANVPGLEPVDLAFGGAAGLGTMNGGAAEHTVPHPRGGTQVGTAGPDRPLGRQGSGTTQSGRPRVTTSPGGVANDAAGRSGGRPGTPARTRADHGGAAGATPGGGATTNGSQGRGAAPSSTQGFSGTTGSTQGLGTAGSRQGRGGTPSGSQGRGTAPTSTQGLSGTASGSRGLGGTSGGGQGHGGATSGRQGLGGTSSGGQRLGGTTTGGQGLGGTTTGGQGLGGATTGGQGLGGTGRGGQGLGGARIPGVTDDYPGLPVASAPGGTDALRAARIPAAASASPRTDAVRAARIPTAAAASAQTDAVRAVRIPAAASASPRTDAVRAARIPAPASASARTNVVRAPRIAAPASARTGVRPAGRTRAKRYETQIPSVVTTDFVTMAKHPLARSRPLYQDVARSNGIPWELLAACDWMQCRAQTQYSPVRGERLGSKNPDGTRFRTKSEALEQCAADLIVLADAVYQIDLTADAILSVLELAQVFAAFRWGRLLKSHRVSAMEFPYSVEGLTVQHLDLRWPDISEPNAPDKPGGRFKMPFGAVPVVLRLNYPAVA